MFLKLGKLSSTGVLEGGGGGATGFLWNFHRYWLVTYTSLENVSQP